MENIEDFKNDLRHVIDANPQPIEFEIKYCNPRTPREKFSTKKEFGLRLLELFADPEIHNIDVNIVELKGYVGRFQNMKNICDWHRFSTTMMRTAKPVVQKNIEKLTFLVETKTDVSEREERYKQMSKDQYFHKHE